MNYEVYLAYSSDYTTQEVNGVDHIMFNDGSYTFYNEPGDAIFIAPAHAVVYIKKV